jgi:mycothiol synthase
VAGVTAPLPDAGLTNRPARTDDAEPIYRLIADCERDLDGVAEVDLDDVVTDMARPGFDPDRDTVLVHDPGGALVGWAGVHRRRAEADVRPDHRGRGIGTWLLDWTERRTREAGEDRVGQTITDNNTAAARMFTGRGYQPKDTAWILEIPLDPGQVVPDPPSGITIRAYQPGVDDRAAHAVIDEAFCEWPDRKPCPFDEWAALVIERETFAPELSVLAFDGDRLVGAALALDYQNEDEGYIHQVATHREYRHRGIARALLRTSFAGFAGTGRKACTLSTNSYTGALSLYEKVGMRIRRSYTHYALALSP